MLFTKGPYELAIVSGYVYTIDIPKREEATMAKWEIRQTVEYWAEDIEADTEEEARNIYLKNQDSYYYGVESETIEELV